MPGPQNISPPAYFAGECDPVQCWDSLSSKKEALLVDVRTEREWHSVGIPDLGTTERGAPALIEWVQLPERTLNPNFITTLQEVVAESPQPVKMIYFLCRSGARSHQAAHASAAVLGNGIACINVREGFEGSGQSHEQDGWRDRGLPCQKL